jgi:hypothetical protein
MTIENIAIVAIFSMAITAKREDSYKKYWRSANFDDD